MANTGTRSIRGSNSHCNPSIEPSGNASNAAVPSVATMAKVILNELAAKYSSGHAS